MLTYMNVINMFIYSFNNSLNPSYCPYLCYAPGYINALFIWPFLVLVFTTGCCFPKWYTACYAYSRVADMRAYHFHYNFNQTFFYKDIIYIHTLH